jgi:DNA-binding NarL/FixJ family response regulator
MLLPRVTVKNLDLHPIESTTPVMLLSAIREEPVAPRLTAAEQDVLVRILMGLSNRQTAAARGTSPRTIANQARSLFQKFGVGSRAELVAVVAPTLHRRLSNDSTLASTDSRDLALSRLSPRQAVAMSLRARGLSVKCISFELGVAMSTVSQQLKLAMRQLRLRSAFGLCALLGERS